MNKYFPDLKFEAELWQAFAVPDVSPIFTKQLQQTLQSQAAMGSPQKRAPDVRQRTKRRWVWVATVLVVIALLLVFRQPVIASLGRLFGYAYIPEMGFVAVDKVRVLENAVQQVHDDRSVTATQGLVTYHGTQLWLTFSDEARPIDDAWLESEDGERFELLSWAYSPDEMGSRGVMGYFSALPAEVNAVTLILPEGWHLPLTWVPGTQSNLTPADVVTLDDPSQETEMPAEPALDSCAEVFEITFCVRAAAREGNDLQVLVESVANGDFNAGSSFSPSMFAVLGEEDKVIVSDAGGAAFPFAGELILSQSEDNQWATTLTFPGAGGLTGPLQVTLPAVLISLPLEEALVVDLGDDPQPGQVIPLDQTVVVDGFTAHFSQAELVGTSETTLTLSIESDPLDDAAAVRLYSLYPGRPEGVEDRYGGGTKVDRFYIHVQLYQNGEVLTGVLRIPLISATLKVRGPFVFGFEAPPETAAPTVTPEVIGDAPYSPLPVGEPLPMDDFEYTGEMLRAGDLLSVEVGERQSLLYAAAAEDGFTQRLVAVLPGEVMAVHAHADLQGLDYLTGPREGNDHFRYEQLYSFRFADATPALLVGQLGRNAHAFDWSYDERFLAYQITEEVPGQGEEYILQLVDLTCRDTADCEPFTVLPSQSVGQLAWSPVAYQIAFAGSSAAYQDSDIFLLSLDPETHTATVENLTRSPNIRDFGSVVWMPTGDWLYYPCETGETEINEYSLCGVDLAAPGDQVVEPLLPWNMHSILLSEGRWVVDQSPVMQERVFKVRTYDLQTGQSEVLLAWPAEGKYPIDIYLSSSTPWMAVAREDLAGLWLVDMATHTDLMVQPTQSDRLLFVGWVPRSD